MIALLMAALTAEAAPNRYGPPLDPKTYVSPDGKWSLHIDPSEPEGSGPGQYRVEQEGRLVWEQDRPFTMWEASITDEGVVAGYAYDTGWYGWGAEINQPGHLLVVALNPDGSERFRSAELRQSPAVFSNPPSPNFPLATGVLLTPESNLVIVRTHREWRSPTETWTRYRLDDGAKLPSQDLLLPDVVNSQFRRAIACAMVPGTSLALVHWYIEGRSDQPPLRAIHRSAHLTLETLDGRRIWERTFVDEYEGRGEYFDGWQLQREGVAQIETGQRSFWFHSFRERQRIQFGIEPGPAGADGWVVSERGREAAGEPVPAGLIAAEDIEREPLGAIELNGDPPGVVRQPVHALSGFDMSSNRTIGLARSASNDTAVLIVDQKGTILAQRAITEATGKYLDIASIGGGLWLVYAGGYDSEQARAWVFNQNDADGPLDPLPELDVKRLGNVEARPDGSFVGNSGPMGGEVRAFDRRGKVLWSTYPFSVQDIAIMDDGRIAVLQGVSKQISFLSSDGKELDGTIDLTTSLGQEPNYPSQLAADRDNGLVLYDFGGKPSVYRLNADGSERARLTTRDPRGAEFRMLGDPQVSPDDGALWCAARDGLLRAGKDGVPDRAIGEISDDRGRPMRGVRSFTVDTQGRFYAKNAQNGWIHVFDAEGGLIRVLGGEAGDFEMRAQPPSIAVFDDGSLLASAISEEDSGLLKAGFVEFDAEGQRKRIIPRVLDDVTETRLAVSGSRRTWAVGYDKLALVDEQEVIVREIRRRPDGSWLGSTAGSAVARNGSIAVVSGPDEMGTRCPCYLSVYDKAGDGVAAIRIPADSVLMQIAFNGETAAMSSNDHVLLVDIKSGRSRRFTLPKVDGEEDYWYLATSANEKELLAIRANSTRVLRFPFE
jgi:hypothetical protein